jgi:hypothetical protein
LREKRRWRVWHIWVGVVLRDDAFFELLLEVDREALEAARKGGCPHCGGGRLDRGNFLRKPRGEPEGVPEDFAVRFSLCCSVDGCRRRLTPASVRFLARRIYVGVAVLLVAAAMQGPSPARVKRLSKSFGMAPRTARRWLAWWQANFAESGLFKSLRGLLRRAVNSEELPRALLEAVQAARPREKAMKVLELLGPITSATAPGALLV